MTEKRRIRSRIMTMVTASQNALSVVVILQL